MKTQYFCQESYTFNLNKWLKTLKHLKIIIYLECTAEKDVSSRHLTYFCQTIHNILQALGIMVKHWCKGEQNRSYFHSLASGHAFNALTHSHAMAIGLMTCSTSAGCLLQVGKHRCHLTNHSHFARLAVDLWSVFGGLVHPLVMCPLFIAFAFQCAWAFGSRFAGIQFL